MSDINKILGPGIHIIEQDEIGKKTDSVAGVDITTGGIVGYFKKGVIGTPIVVTPNNFESILGGPIANAYGYYSLKGYFDNGAEKAYVVRTAHYTDPADASTLTAKKSSVTIKDRADAPADTFVINASSEGSWGDKVAVMIYDNPLVNTTLAEAAESGATSVKLKSIKGVTSGLNLKIGNSYFLVKSFDTITKVVNIEGTIGTAVEADTAITSTEFAIDVYEDGVLVEQHSVLDIREESENYFESVVNNDSQYIQVEDLFSESTYPTNMPKSSEAVMTFLTGGDDGLADVSVADLRGNENAGTGIYALKKTREAFRLWCPESTSEELALEMDKFCKDYKYAVSVRPVPEGYSDEEAIAFREDVGSFDTSFGNMIDGWGYVDDPIGVGKNPQKLVPLSGHVIGMWARLNSENDISIVPAGEGAVIYGVNALEKELDELSIAKLNNVGINCIIYIKGIGIVLWGARTLSSNKKFKFMNARAIFEYVEKSLQEGTRWAAFQPTNETTWNRIALESKNFLNTVPGLKGKTPEERYVCICDASNNTEEIIAQGQIVCDVGLNIEGVGEVVMFRIGHVKSVTSVTDSEE